MTVAPMKAHLRAHPNLMRRLGALHGEQKVENVARVLDELTAVDSLAVLLTEGINTVTAKDGRLDTKDLAAFVLKRMKENQE
jgi:hypothetical protein